MRDLREGVQLAGRYTLLRPIGAGGMATLWSARDAQAETTVVLKFLREPRASDPKERDRFRREWQLASRLMHAHIVRVFEYYDDEDGPYYAQQFVDGPSIAEIAGQPLDQLLRPLGLLADALRYAHGKGIVHNDLTAANIRLDRHGAPYLLDFGVAVPAGANAAGAGTPVAQSPQQAAGAPSTPADDVYAFGVLLHELLFDRPPVAGDLPRQASSGEDIPTAVRELLQRMLATEPRERPAAAELREALEAAGFAAGAAVVPQQPGALTAGAADIAVQSIRPAPVAPANRVSGTATADKGIPMPVVLGGLAVLLLAFLGVLFLLPDAVEPERDPSPAAAADAPAVAEQPESAAAATSDAEVAETFDAELPAEEAFEALPFSENRGAAGGTSAERLKAATDEALGDLLSRLQRLRYRGIDRWGGEEFRAALARYAEGDKAYIDKDFKTALAHYRAVITMLDPFFDRIPGLFRDTLAEARAAFDAQNHREAIRLYDLAVAITPGNPAALQGLERAKNLESVLNLMERGRAFEKSLEYAAARQAYQSALELDPAWQAASDGLARVNATLQQLAFEQRMTEGFAALAAGNFDVAKAAFETARTMRPGSPQPADGLQQLDQAVRLARIRDLERTAARQEQAEEWEAAVDTYNDALSVDPDLQFAQQGLQRASYRAGLHRRLKDYIDNPDSLSAPPTMQAATQLLLELSRVSPSGPRLEDQKELLARLLKRAATPLNVEFRSDNLTEVSLYRIGSLGTFATRTLELRPGTYVAVGSRPGYRDVRLEFRVAPEIDLQPVVVQCEEQI